MSRSEALSRVLFVDALTCVGCGLLLTLGAGALDPLLGLPEALLFGAGVSLFPIAALMAVVGSVPRLQSWGGWAIVAGNVVWVALSLAVMIDMSPTLLGEVFVGGQALVVAVLAVAEARLCRMPRTDAALA